jgi:hypothetical protein
LNDMAPDGSQSAFPQRAKYLLSLDSTFLPNNIQIESNSINEDRLASLDSRVRESVVALVDKHGHKNPLVNLPRTPEVSEINRLQSLFELGHKRLAATNYKWALRTYLLASFYTTLENHLVRGQTIRVPLATSDRGSQLQRHWKAVNDAFKSTVLFNEAVSLLFCVMSLTPEERQAQEQAWLQEEASEIRDFADYYLSLRAEFNPESITTETDRRALAEQLIDYAKKVLSAGTMGNVSLVKEFFLKREMRNQRILWPRLFGEDVHRCLPELRVRKDCERIWY